MTNQEDSQNKKKTVLVTGGAGFIGSHICVELLSEGFNVIIVDNFCNSKDDVIKRIESITNKIVTFYKADIRDREALENIFNKYSIDSVIHCAGLKSVGESVKDPILYYDNNVNGSVVLFEIMKKFNVKKLIFSSSATVYDSESSVPYTENSPLKPSNPYGNSKLFVENILRDISSSDKEWRIAILRYFNPIGAHSSGLIGENPNGVPNNLMPYISKVAQGIYPEVIVFGNDYETVDGTGVRDYIHVVDLALGHLKALEYLYKHTGVLTANLGTGKGVSVLEFIKLFENVSGKSIPYRIISRRAGDIAISYAEVTFAEKELGWAAKNTIEKACEDEWRWQQSNGVI